MTEETMRTTAAVTIAVMAAASASCGPLEFSTGVTQPAPTTYHNNQYGYRAEDPTICERPYPPETNSAHVIRNGSRCLPGVEYLDDCGDCWLVSTHKIGRLTSNSLIPAIIGTVIADQGNVRSAAGLFQFVTVYHHA